MLRKWPESFAKSWQHCTDKKENQIFLIYKEIQSGAVAKSFMRKGFLIYEEMRKYFPIYEEAVSHIRLCNCSILNFLIYEKKLIFFFISVVTTPETVCGRGASLEQRRLDRVHGEVVYIRWQRRGRGGRQQGRRQRSIGSNHAKYLYVHCKKRLAIFPSPAGMSQTILSLGGNN